MCLKKKKRLIEAHISPNHLRSSSISEWRLWWLLTVQITSNSPARPWFVRKHLHNIPKCLKYEFIIIIGAVITLPSSHDKTSRLTGYHREMRPWWWDLINYYQRFLFSVFSSVIHVLITIKNVNSYFRLCY